VVLDAQTGEPLARVSVQVVEPSLRTVSGANGGFELGALNPGEYDLKAFTVGYRLLQTHIRLQPGTPVELSLALSPDTFQRTEKIDVHGDLTELGRRSVPPDFTIGGNDIKNLSTVLADDPLRAVQSMPGVTGNDDFESRFTLHGAPYERVGLYLDGILLHTPFHTVQGEGPSGSMTVFNGDMVDSMSLSSEGYGAKYGDRTAGALDVRTRDGSRSEPSFRLNAGVADSGALGEGPLGGHGSWLASFRKSYLQYLVPKSADESSMAFGFQDSQAQLNYDLGRGSNVKLKLLDGVSDFDRTDARDVLPLNSSMLARYRFSLADLQWQYAPDARFLVTTHAAFLRERYDDSNRERQPLGGGFYGEWVGKSDASWVWNPSATLDFGVSARRVRGEGFADYYAEDGHIPVEGHRGNLLLLGGYVQQSWSGFGKRLFVTGGARWDRVDAGPAAVVSPSFSVTFLPAAGTRLQLSWGQTAQFPDVQSLYSIYGSTRLMPERATHYAAALEQSLGGKARLRVVAYERRDRDLLFRPDQEARLVGGQILGDNFQAPIASSLGGYARGIDIFVQRRSANRLTGWVSYSLAWSRQHDSATGAVFPSDQDQRHTVNVYLGYRIRPSVNLSARWTYGSGFPIPGYFQRVGDAYYLSSVRNQARMDSYQRADLRINKTRAFDHWKLTVYGEVVNLLNHPNYRFDSYNGYAPSGQAYLSFSNLFPILPSAGVMLEF
jgi:hypothetical protein